MKNINELIGLINGINFDGVINQKEKLYYGLSTDE